MKVLSLSGALTLITLATARAVGVETSLISTTDAPLLKRQGACGAPCYMSCGNTGNHPAPSDCFNLINNDLANNAEANIFFNGTAIQQYKGLGSFTYGSCSATFQPLNGGIIEYCLRDLGGVVQDIVNSCGSLGNCNANDGTWEISVYNTGG